MHLLHKNQENFCLQTVFPMGPISKMTPFWPTFGFPNSTQTPEHHFWKKFSKKIFRRKKWVPKKIFEIRFLHRFIGVFLWSHKNFEHFCETFFFGRVIFWQKSIFAFFSGRMCEIFQGERAMFFSSFLVLFEEKKIRGGMPKSTFPFSHTDPQKTHFSKKKFFGQKTHFFRKKSCSEKWKFFAQKPQKVAKTRCKKPISKIFFGTHFFSKIEKSKIWNPKPLLCWVEFGNQKVGQNGVIFEMGPIGKTVWRQKFSWFLCSKCIYFRAI